jgi:dihydroorotate dehydrogenase (NAD+) catalytic subunit
MNDPASQVSFLGVPLQSRSVLASGILGVTLSSLRRVHGEGAGLVTTKSIGPEKRKGHKAPVLFRWEHGFINAVGLSNPGMEDFLTEWKNYRIDFPIALSIFGKTESDFSMLAEQAEVLGFTFLELNISCPNVLDEFGTPFSFSPELTYRITKSVKEKTQKPVIVKLSPNTPLMKKVARSAEEAGADALCVMNTLGPGMVIDTHTGSPVLGNRTGGISGEAVLPVTVRHVYELYREVGIPIIGVGGVSSVDGALQVLMAGAQLYGVGSAIYEKGFDLFREIDGGIEEFLSRNGLSHSRELVGLAHRDETAAVGVSDAPRHPRSPRARRFFHVTERERRRDRFTVSPVEEVVSGEGGAVKTLFFRLNDREPPEPGQFFMLWLPGVDQKPYSVSWRDGALNDGALRAGTGEGGRIIGFSLKARGLFSRALMAAELGSPVGLLGPLGSSFDLEQKDPYLLAGGGIGLAPLLFAASVLIGKGKRVCLAAGAKDTPSLAWMDCCLERSGVNRGRTANPGPGRFGGGAAEKDPLLSIFRFTEDGSIGVKGMITDHLQGVIDAVRPGFALVCGPELFMKEAIEIFGANGIKGQASVERIMKCGVGICGSCSLDGSGDRVCVEGPVFGFDYLDRLGEFGRYHRDESGTMRELT